MGTGRTIHRMQEQPHSGRSPTRGWRLSPRIQGYDYAQEGAYFITVCTFDRVCLFGSVREGRSHVNGPGAAVVDCWRAIPIHSPEVQLDEFVVMPNHIHGILRIAHDDQPPASPGGLSIAVIVGEFKAAATKAIHELDGFRKVRVWQRSYYDHVLRSDSALAHIRQYIVDNPLKWHLDEENPERRRTSRPPESV